MRYENLHISVFHPPKQQGFESTPRQNLSIVREYKIKFANPLTHLALSPIYQYRWRIMVDGNTERKNPLLPPEPTAAQSTSGKVIVRPSPE